MPLLATSKSSSSAESDFSVEALSRSFLHSCPVTSCEGSSALLTSPDNSPSCPTSSCPSAGLLVSKTLLSSTCESSLHGRTCSSDTAFSFSTSGVSVMSTSVSLLSLSTSSAIFLQLSSSLFPLSTFSDVIPSMHPSLPLSSSIFFSFDCFIWVIAVHSCCSSPARSSMAFDKLLARSVVVELSTSWTSPDETLALSTLSVSLLSVVCTTVSIKLFSKLSSVLTDLLVESGFEGTTTVVPFWSTDFSSSQIWLDIAIFSHVTSVAPCSGAPCSGAPCEFTSPLSEMYDAEPPSTPSLPWGHDCSFSLLLDSLTGDDRSEDSTASSCSSVLFKESLRSLSVLFWSFFPVWASVCSLSVMLLESFCSKMEGSEEAFASPGLFVPSILSCFSASLLLSWSFWSGGSEGSLTPSPTPLIALASSSWSLGSLAISIKESNNSSAAISSADDNSCGDFSSGVSPWFMRPVPSSLVSSAIAQTLKSKSCIKKANKRYLHKVSPQICIFLSLSILFG